jgi:hypothetical protein
VLTRRAYAPPLAGKEYTHVKRDRHTP